MFSIRPLHLGLILMVLCFWGFNFAMVKVGLRDLPPFMLTSLRFFAVALLLTPFVKPPRGRWRDMLVISMLLGVAHFALMFNGLTGLDASTAAISIQLQVPFASLLAAIFMKDKLGWRRALGMLIAFAGVVIIAGEPRLDGQYVYLGMVISAACLWAVANLVIKMQRPMDGMTLLAWMSVFASPCLLALSFVFEDNQWEALSNIGFDGIYAVVYQSLFVVVIGYGVWYHLLRQYSLNVMMPFTLLLPPIGVLSGVVVLGERLSITFLIGAAVTVVGVAIILIRRPTTASPEIKGT
jgi:O-acetylserine/cysteine efflux transporter